MAVVHRLVHWLNAKLRILNSRFNSCIGFRRKPLHCRPFLLSNVYRGISVDADDDCTGYFGTSFHEHENLVGSNPTPATKIRAGA